MRAVNDRSVGGPPSERRNRRTTCLSDALRFQLDACREEEGLAAIVVSDELGFCVAHSGGDGDHAELAAQLPIFAGPAQALESDGASDDELPQPPPGLLAVTTFSAAGATLHAGAVGAAGERGDVSDLAVLERVASGFSRMLAE